MARANVYTLDAGLSREEALRLALDFLRRLREEPPTMGEAKLSDAAIDLLHAACEILQDSDAYDLANPLADAEKLYRFIEKAAWPDPDFGERDELKVDCAFAAWHSARKTQNAREIVFWEAELCIALSVGGPLRQKAENLLATIPKRNLRADEFCEGDALLLYGILEILRQRREEDPTTVRAEAEYFYRFVEGVPPRKKGQVKTDKFQLDEREYFLGEAALIAGTTCRVLSRRDEARCWFELAEGWFLLDENNVGDLSRLNYQKLALLTEERHFDEVWERLPAVLAGCEQSHLAQEALKCRILEGNIFSERGQLREAVAVFREVCRQGRIVRSSQVLAAGYVNLLHLHGELNEPEEAIEASRAAMPILNKLGNRIAWAKLQWGLGILYRSQGNRTAAVEAFHLAQVEFERLGMQAEVAVLHLMVADLLLDYGLDHEAKREIEAALPIIDEYKLIPEGVAALTLLRESLRRQKIDRQALRNLHEHFEPKKP